MSALLGLFSVCSFLPLISDGEAALFFFSAREEGLAGGTMETGSPILIPIPLLGDGFFSRALLSATFLVLSPAPVAEVSEAATQ